MRWETAPLLEVEHLTMRFGGLVAVNDVTFGAGRGDIIAIIGPFNSGVAMSIIPIANEAGLAMVSPSNTYTGLTVSAACNVSSPPTPRTV